MSARKDLKVMHDLLVAMIWMSVHDHRAEEAHCVAIWKAHSNACVQKALSAIQ